MPTFLTLPREIREEIYEHTFLPPPNLNQYLSSASLQPSIPHPIPEILHASILALFLRPASGFPLRLVNKSIFTESASAYQTACTTNSAYRWQMLEILAAESREYRNEMEGLTVRLLLSEYARRVLLPGDARREDTSDSEAENSEDEDEDEDEDEMEAGCSHLCPAPSALSCFCAEHTACFRCGRWLALAWLLECHREITGWSEVLVGEEDGVLTPMGRLVEEGTELASPSENEFGLPEQMYCSEEAMVRVAEAWWRFEFERAKVGWRRRVLYEEMRGRIGVDGEQSLLTGIGLDDVGRWLAEVEFLEKWNRHLRSQGLESVFEVDGLRRLLVIVQPRANEPWVLGGGAQGGSGS